MNGGRLVRFLVLWLVLLPVVMAASDTAEHTAKGDLFRIPHLRENGRYTYDAVLRSEFNDLDVRVEDYVVVEVGVVQERVVQGSTFRVLPVTQTRGWAPWDTYASLRADPFLPPEWTEHWTRTTETQWIDVARGVVVERNIRETGGAKDAATGDGIVLDATRDEFAPVDSAPFRWGMTPGERVATPMDWMFRTMAKVAQADFPTVEKGLLEGRVVYNVKTWGNEPADVRQGGFGSCSLYYPEVWYQDFPLGRHIDGRPVWSDEKSDVWISADQALPLLQECRLTIRDRNEAGPVIEDLHFATVLSDHTSGGAEVPIHHERHGQQRAELQGVLTASATLASGVPEDGDSGLAFPLHEAYAELLDAQDPEVSSFLDEASGSIHVHSAQFAAEEEESQDSPVPGSVRDAMARVRPQEPSPARSERWILHVVDDAGNGIRGSVSRDVDERGTALGTRVLAVQGVDLSAHWVPMSTVDLVPLGSLLDHHETETGLRPDHFELVWSVPEASYLFATPATSSTRSSDGSTDKGHEYRASDGLLLERWTRSTTTTEADTADPYTTMSGSSTGLLPKVESGRLALASGIMLTLVIALTYFWDLLFRAFAHSAVVLYAKVGRDKALDHPARQQIHDLVTAQPGIVVKDIRDATDLGHGTVMFHLATLEHVGLLTSVKVGRERAWFVPGQVDHSERGRHVLLASEAVRRVFRLIEEHPGIHQQRLAELLGTRPVSVRFHLRRLEDAGLVTPGRDGRRTTYRVAGPRSVTGTSAPVAATR